MGTAREKSNLYPKGKEELGTVRRKVICTQKKKENWVQRGKKAFIVSYTQKKKGNGAGRKETEYGSL